MQESGKPVNKSKDVKHGRHVRMIVSACLLQIFEGLLAQRHGDLVASLRRVLDD